MSVIVRLLGSDDCWQTINFTATRIARGNWRCEERVHGRLLDEREGLTKAEARDLLRSWGATRLCEAKATGGE